MPKTIGRYWPHVAAPRDQDECDCVECCAPARERIAASVRVAKVRRATRERGATRVGLAIVATAAGFGMLVGAYVGHVPPPSTSAVVHAAVAKAEAEAYRVFVRNPSCAVWAEANSAMPSGFETIADCPAPTT